MKVGVIGANGFIGSYLTTRLLRDKHEVYAFYNRAKENLSSGVILMHINELAASDIDFDLLYISVGSFQNPYPERVNQLTALTETLRRLKFKKIILLSSVSVYGIHEEIINAESGFDNPTEYGLSKLAFEYIVNQYPVVITLRFTYIYGKGMDESSLLPRWIKLAKDHHEILVFGDGSRKQDYLSIYDAIDFCIAAINCNAKNVFICATGKSYSNLEVANCIKSHFPGCKLLLSGIDSSPSFEYDIKKTIHAFNMDNFISLRAGIDRLINC